MQVPIAYFAVLIIWSTTPLAIVWSSETIPPTLAVLFRMVLALVLGFFVLRFKRISLPWDPVSFRLYRYSAIGVFGGMTCAYLSAAYLPSGILSLVFGLAPILSSLLGYKILNEDRLTRLKISAMTICLVGLAIVCIDSVVLAGNTINYYTIFGLLLALTAVFMFSLSGVLVKSVQIEIHPLATTMGTLCVSTPLFFIAWLILDGGFQVSDWSYRSLASTFYLGVFGSLIGFYAYYLVLQKLTASTVALITLITPVIAITLGSILNDEPLTFSLIFGALIIVFGLALYNQKMLLKR